MKKKKHFVGLLLQGWFIVDTVCGCGVGGGIYDVWGNWLWLWVVAVVQAVGFL